VGNTANSMSYWVFTDIFEEAGVRFGAFHGGFGLLTIQGINKPAFYAYQFLNKLGKTELANADSASWACKSNKGVQVLLWDFTNTHPGDSVHNQKYYIQDLPAKAKGKVKVSVSGMPAGSYTLKIYQTGYRVNDAYTSFLDMKKPMNLNREQLAKIKNSNNGAAIATISVQVKADGKLVKELNIRENDVFLLDISKK
jgi:xylan 1,4-beta-xylosidase